MITLQVAIIEWDEELSPTVHIAHTVDELHQLIRSDIEAECTDWAGSPDDRHAAIGAYVVGPGKLTEDYDAWHEALHEHDGTPWVTKSEYRLTPAPATSHG